MRRVLPATLLLLAALCGCGGDRSGEEIETPPLPDVAPTPVVVDADADPASYPDILIVVLDTTGPKVIAEEMPNTQRFLDSSRNHTRAIAPSNSTMESVAGMMTGGWMSNALLWNDGFVTLSEALQRRGYHGFIGSANPVLDHPFYLRGFDQTHVAVHDITRDFPDRGLVEAFEGAWEGLPRPRLAWVQMIACHDYRIAQKNYIDDGPARGEAGLKEAWDAYVQDCRATDELMPRLFDANPEGITVVTADHGELFGHLGPYALPKQFEHGHGVSDSPMEIHVPLGIRGPGFEAGTVGTPTSTLDIRSTLLRIAGAEGAGADLRTGEGLTAAVSAGCEVYDTPTYHYSARVRDDGSHVVRVTGPDDVPGLFRWQPAGKVGLQPREKLKLKDLDAVEQRLLFDDAKLECVPDRELCAQHPEIASLGYIDCD